VIIRDETFEKEVLKSKINCLIYIFAPWCGSCKLVSKFVDQLELQYDKKKVKIFKYDCDANEECEIPLKYDINKIPSYMFFKKGKLEKIIHGGLELDKLMTNIEEILL